MLLLLPLPPSLYTLSSKMLIIIVCLCMIASLPFIELDLACVFVYYFWDGRSAALRLACLPASRVQALTDEIGTPNPN